MVAVAKGVDVAGTGSATVGFSRGAIAQRLELELGSSVRQSRRWTLARVCGVVDLIVDLQQLALRDRQRYDVLLACRKTQVRVWLYEVLVAAAALGFDEVAPVLIDALPGVDMADYRSLLVELGALPQACLKVVGGAR